jgi:hypothetical protein
MKMQDRDGRTAVPTALPAASVAITSAKAVVTAMNCKPYKSAYYTRIENAFLLAFIVEDDRF